MLSLKIWLSDGNNLPPALTSMNSGLKREGVKEGECLSLPSSFACVWVRKCPRGVDEETTTDSETTFLL